MELINQVIQLGNVEKDNLEQICFRCPALLKEDIKEIGKHYNLTTTSLIVNALTIIAQDFKGGEISTLNIHQSRACLKLDDLEESLEPYLADSQKNEDCFEHRGYLLNREKAEDYQVKLDRIIDRIENLKKVIGENEQC